MKSERRDSAIKKLLVLSVTMIAIILFIISNRQYLYENPFDPTIQIGYISDSTVGATDNIYIIDQSKRRIVAFNQEGELLFQIRGGIRRGNSFYSAKDMIVDRSGSLYVLDMVLALDGSTIEQERIVKFNAKGKFEKVIYQMVYEEENRPNANGRIHAMTLHEGNLLFVFSEKTQFSLEKISLSDFRHDTIKTIPYDTSSLLSYLIEKQTNEIYAVTKTAEIITIRQTDKVRLLYQGEEYNNDIFYSIPWEIAIDDQNHIIFTDIGLRQVKMLNPDETLNVIIDRGRHNELKDSSIYYKVNVSEDNVLSATLIDQVFLQRISGATSDQAVIYGNGEGAVPIKASSGYMIFRWLVYLLIPIVIVLLIWEIQIIISLGIRPRFSEMAKSNLLIITVAIVIAVSVVLSIMETMKKQYIKQVMNHMSSAAELICNSLNSEDISAINSPQDYQSEHYRRVKTIIQKGFQSENDWNNGLYCVLNRVDENGIIYSCVYLEDTIGVVFPLDWPYEGSEYEEIYNLGKQIPFEWVENADGIWSYVLAPVVDDNGKVIAALEVGANLYAFRGANQVMVRNMIFQVVAIVAIIILIFTELSCVWHYRNIQQKATENRESLAVYRIRPMVFIIFMADCMATAFLPILAKQLAQPVWGIPIELMSVIPISIEVLMTAIFSFIGGYLLERKGIRNILISGSLLFTTGLTLAGFSRSIISFVMAKAVIGIGVGLLLVCLTTLIASYPEREKYLGFSFYNAGSLAGLTVGTTMGSFLVAYLGYFNIYFVAALLSASVLLLIVTSIRGDTVLPRSQVHNQYEMNKKISLQQFLIKKEVIVYFSCAMVPYLICGYFLSYLMPLFAESVGMAAATIGQLFLINGACVIYLGPSMTNYLTKKIGLKGSIVMAAGIYIFTLILFLVFPGNVMLLFSALLFGIADSFGFSALSIYFAGMDRVAEYGSGKAMGIHSTLENVAQSVGPFVFSGVLVLGIGRGILMIVVGYVILQFLYVLLSRTSKGGRNHENVGTNRSE